MSKPDRTSSAAQVQDVERLTGHKNGCPHLHFDQGPCTCDSTAAQDRREWSDDDWITCPRCEGQKYDRGSCGLCGNLGVLEENGERFHCDCRADDWVEGDNQAIRCETCGGYAGEPGTSIR